jgi:hypothetical protein
MLKINFSKYVSHLLRLKSHCISVRWVHLSSLFTRFMTMIIVFVWTHSFIESCYLWDASQSSQSCFSWDASLRCISAFVFMTFIWLLFWRRISCGYRKGFCLQCYLISLIILMKLISLIISLLNMISLLNKRRWTLSFKSFTL